MCRFRKRIARDHISRVAIEKGLHGKQIDCTQSGGYRVLPVCAPVHRHCAESAATRGGVRGLRVGFADDGIVSEGLIGGAARFYLRPRISIGPELVYIGGTGHSHLIVTGNVTWDLFAPSGGRASRTTPFLVWVADYSRRVNRFSQDRSRRARARSRPEAASERPSATASLPESRHAPAGRRIFVSVDSSAFSLAEVSDATKGPARQRHRRAAALRGRRCRRGNAMGGLQLPRSNHQRAGRDRGSVETALQSPSGSPCKGSWWRSAWVSGRSLASAAGSRSPVASSSRLA